MPQNQLNAVSDALIARLGKIVVGDPAQEGVKMGALVNIDQRQDVQEKVDLLVAAGCQILLGGKADDKSRRRILPADIAALPAAR